MIKKTACQVSALKYASRKSAVTNSRHYGNENAKWRVPRLFFLNKFQVVFQYQAQPIFGDLDDLLI
ncbi:hypothetical protein [Acidovorax sp. 94]|uniref:hypothetical protein n=1 Tax=Acidovorax sp. 94 TaxID=2135633 RepID=UPI001314E638|nr:hypothetical protein [Acidovorax sp. 94]